MTEDSPFVLRALNYWRRENQATYVGLRYLLTGIKGDANAVLSSWVKRRATTARANQYYETKQFKGSGAHGYEYRDCLNASPMTALGESLVLSALESEPTFLKPPWVYSYRWPKFG
jgi:hypothetical protein